MSRSIFALLLCMLVSRSALAAWDITTRMDEIFGYEIKRAFVENDNSARLEVLRTNDDAILIEISIKGGFDKFTKTRCPSIQIDKLQLIHHISDRASCRMAARTAYIRIAQIDGDSIDSPLFFGLLNGSRIYVRYLTGNGDYREAVFSLRGSKKAIMDAIGGEDIEVIEYE